MSSIFERNPKKTLVVVILVLVAAMDFALANIYRRADSDVRTVNKYYHHDLIPSVQKVSDWGGEYLLTTNSMGFKDDSTRLIPKTTDKYRILFMGDSFTEGIGLPYEQTFVGLIDRQLEDSVDVLNAGVASYSPKLYLSKIKYLIEEKKLDFDEVALFIDISDMQDEIVYSGWGTKVYFGDALEKLALDNSVIARIIEKRGWIKNIRSMLGLNPILPKNVDVYGFQRDYNSERGRWTYDANVYDGKWGAMGVALALSNLSELHSLLVRNNIKLSITVYPWPEQIIKGDLNSRQVKIWGEFCKERGIPFLNLFPKFFSLSPKPSNTISEYFIKGDNHWNKSGHAVVAQQWSKFRCMQLNAECFQNTRLNIQWQKSRK